MWKFRSFGNAETAKVPKTQNPTRLGKFPHCSKMQSFRNCETSQSFENTDICCNLWKFGSFVTPKPQSSEIPNLCQLGTVGVFGNAETPKVPKTPKSSITRKSSNVSDNAETAKVPKTPKSFPTWTTRKVPENAKFPKMRKLPKRRKPPKCYWTWESSKFSEIQKRPGCLELWDFLRFPSLVISVISPKAIARNKFGFQKLEKLRNFTNRKLKYQNIRKAHNVWNSKRGRSIGDPKFPKFRKRQNMPPQLGKSSEFWEMQNCQISGSGEANVSCARNNRCGGNSHCPVFWKGRFDVLGMTNVVNRKPQVSPARN